MAQIQTTVALSDAEIEVLQNPINSWHWPHLSKNGNWSEMRGHLSSSIRHPMGREELEGVRIALATHRDALEVEYSKNRADAVAAIETLTAALEMLS